jgi:hypothetical protein
VVVPLSWDSWSSGADLAWDHFSSASCRSLGRVLIRALPRRDQAVGCLATGRSLRFPLRIHGLLIAQGALFFGLTIAVYRAEQHCVGTRRGALFDHGIHESR